MIEVKNLGLSIGSKSLLAEVSFGISPGERVYIIGPNGAGKTSLLRCLFGLRKYSGVVKVLGEDVTKIERARLARLASYIPQQTPTLPRIPVHEFLKLARTPYLESVFGRLQSQTELIESALEQTDCLALKHQTLDTLSGGERQRVLLAAALVQETEIILMDEPTAHLDPKHRAALSKILERLKDKTLVIVSHSFEGLSGRVIALKDGQLFFDGPSKKLLHSENLPGLFDCQFTKAEVLIPT